MQRGETSGSVVDVEEEKEGEEGTQLGVLKNRRRPRSRIEA
jgi:hypothetical protein